MAFRINKTYKAPKRSKEEEVKDDIDAFLSDDFLFNLDNKSNKATSKSASASAPAPKPRLYKSSMSIRPIREAQSDFF